MVVRVRVRVGSGSGSRVGSEWSRSRVKCWARLRAGVGLGDDLRGPPLRAGAQARLHLHAGDDEG